MTVMVIVVATFIVVLTVYIIGLIYKMLHKSKTALEKPENIIKYYPADWDGVGKQQKAATNNNVEEEVEKRLREVFS